MQHTQVDVLIMALPQEITGRNNCIRQQMTIWYKFRCPFDETIIKCPNKFRVSITESQRTENKRNGKMYSMALYGSKCSGSIQGQYDIGLINLG